jgi:hypothetical protein
MSRNLLADLTRRGALSLLQFSADEWQNVKNTRNGLSRFLLTFDHDTARSGKKNWLVLIAVANGQFCNPLADDQDTPELYLAVVNSIATVATFSSRVVFSSTEKLTPPRPVRGRTSRSSPAGLHFCPEFPISFAREGWLIQSCMVLEPCNAARISPGASFHVLRHTYASHLVMAGGAIAVAAANLGHSDTRMTEKHYAHLGPTMWPT